MATTQKSNKKTAKKTTAKTSVKKTTKAKKKQTKPVVEPKVEVIVEAPKIEPVAVEEVIVNETPKKTFMNKEIVEQVLTIQRDTGLKITNVVFMGQGEPLLNLENVLKALEMFQAAAR